MNIMVGGPMPENSIYGDMFEGQEVFKQPKEGAVYISLVTPKEAINDMDTCIQAITCPAG